jgi:tetratricopeptide (TPR) repeat protein
MADSGEKYPVSDEIAQDYERARELTEEEEYEAAETLLKDILEREPDHPRVMFTLGVLYFHSRARTPDEREGFRRSEEIMMTVIDLAPDLAEAHSFLSIIFTRAGRISEAAKQLELALRLDAESAENWTSLGLYYALERDYRTALEYFLAALSLEPGYYVAAYNAGCVYAELGNTEEALKYLKLGLKSKRLITGAENDTDFDAIRDLPEFQDIITSAKEKLGKHD